METITYNTNTSPIVVIEKISGDLQVRGWDRPELKIQAHSSDLEVIQEEDQFTLNVQSNCSVFLPKETSLQVKNVYGNAALKNIRKECTIGDVHGSLSLRAIHDITIGLVHGNFNCREVNGDVEVNDIDGNVSVRNIQGDCQFQQVKGNLDLRSVEGAIGVSAQGNVYLRLDILSGASYQVCAEGNLHCRVPIDSNLEFDLTCQAEKIKISLPEGVQTHKGLHHKYILGDGSIPISLSSDGSLFIEVRDEMSEFAAYPKIDFSDVLPDEISLQIASQVEAQINTQMEQMTQQINQQISHLSEKVIKAGLSPEEAERIMEQVLKTTERETSRAQEKMRRTQEKLERKLESALQHVQQKDRFRDRRTQRGSKIFPDTESAKSVSITSDDERLMILRMLEEKKITLEQAENLLSLLESEQP